MKQFCYVVVRADTSDYATRVIANSTEDMDNSAKWQRDHLDRLLQAGWQPVRETAMGGAGQGYAAYCLLLLEKEVAPVLPVLSAEDAREGQESRPPFLHAHVPPELESKPPSVIEAVSEVLPEEK